MMQYKNNLIGKHFKTLTQTMSFHLYGLATSDQIKLVHSVGILGGLLWLTEITNESLVSHQFFLILYANHKIIE